jgi:glycosyltransferase involved in cell wall biosynthesis
VSRQGLHRPRRLWPLASASGPAAARPALVHFAPLPPEPSGIADYAAELLPGLARHFELTAVIDDRAPEPPPGLPCQVLRLHDYLARARQYDEAAHLYHLGNNRGHVYLLPTLLRRPGLVVLHDATLHHLIDQASLRWGDLALYRHWLWREHGAAGASLATAVEQGVPRERAMFQDLPLTRLLLRAARGVIVHSGQAKRQVRADAPGVPVVELPHHAAPAALAAAALDRGQARGQLGQAQDGLLIVALGFVTRAKRIDRTLTVLANPAWRTLDWRFVIAGDTSEAGPFLQARVRQLGLEDRVHFAGYVDDNRFHLWCRAADIVVNLRWPSGGETSGSLVRALAAGACVVVNDIGPFAELPDGVCAKVAISAEGQDPGLEATLHRLATDRAARARLGAAAHAWVAATQQLSGSVAAYTQAIRRLARPPGLQPGTAAALCFARPADHERRLAALPAAVRRRLPLWAAAGWAPLGQAGRRVLLLRTDAEAAGWLTQLFGYSPDDIDASATAAAASREGPRFDLAVLDLSDAPASASDWLAAAADALHTGGLLLVSTRHDHRAELERSLPTLGLEVIETPSCRTHFSPALDLIAQHDDPGTGATVLRAVAIGPGRGHGRWVA